MSRIRVTRPPCKGRQEETGKYTQSSATLRKTGFKNRESSRPRLYVIGAVGLPKHIKKRLYNNRTQQSRRTGNISRNREDAGGGVSAAAAPPEEATGDPPREKRQRGRRGGGAERRH